MFSSALGGIFVLAAVVVLCNVVITRAETYLLRSRPRAERKDEGELYWRAQQLSAFRRAVSQSVKFSRIVVENLAGKRCADFTSLC